MRRPSSIARATARKAIARKDGFAMIRGMTFILDWVLVGYIVREVWAFNAHYRQLKQDLARGDRDARMRLYRRAFVFEWVSAGLALAALRFDWTALRPDALALGASR